VGALVVPAPSARALIAKSLSRKQSEEIFAKSRFHPFLSNFYGVKTNTRSDTQASGRLSDQPAASSPTPTPRPSSWQRPWWQWIALLPLLYLGYCLGLAILIVACVAWPFTIMGLGLVVLTRKGDKR
jgi:hypothetical protein